MCSSCLLPGGKKSWSPQLQPNCKGISCQKAISCEVLSIACERRAHRERFWSAILKWTFPSWTSILHYPSPKRNLILSLQGDGWNECPFIQLWNQESSYKNARRCKGYPCNRKITTTPHHAEEDQVSTTLAKQSTHSHKARTSYSRKWEERSKEPTTVPQ